MSQFSYFDEYSAGSLTLAVRNNDVKQLKRLVEQGADFLVYDNRGYLAIHEASERGHVGALKALLSVDGVKEEINAKSHEGQTCAFLAAREGHPEIIEVLAKEGGADLDLTDLQGQTPMHTACQRNQSKCVEVLLKFNASYLICDDYIGNMPLHIACDENSIECIEAILKHIPRSVDVVNAENDIGIPPIAYTFMHSDMRAMKLLLGSGATYGSRSTFKDPLMVCCVKGTPSMIEYFLSIGADLLWQDNKQQQPIDYLVERGDPIIMKSLLRYFQSYGPKVCYEQVVKTFEAICEESIENYEPGFPETLDLVLACMKNNKIVGSTDFLLVLVKYAGQSLMLLEALSRMNLLDLLRQVSIRCTFADLVLLGTNVHCMRYVLRKMVNASQYDDYLYWNSYLYLQKFLARFHNDSTEMEASDYELTRKLLLYITPRGNLPLLDMFKEQVRHIPALIQVLVLYDIHEGVETNALYKDLAEPLKNKRIHGMLASPSSLQHLCRHVVRSSLGSRLREVHDGLDIPYCIADYIQFKDIAVFGDNYELI